MWWINIQFYKVKRGLEMNDKLYTIKRNQKGTAPFT